MREAGAAGLHEHGLVDGVSGHLRQEHLNGCFAFGGHARGDLAWEFGTGAGKDVQVRVDSHSGLPLSWGAAEA